MKILFTSNNKLKLKLYLTLLYFIINIWNFRELTAQQNYPNLPDVKSVITCFPDTTGYKIITVGPSNRDFDNLQLALNSAELGTIILLDAGETFIGGFKLPNKTIGNGWIIIMSSLMELLPVNEVRIDPEAFTGNKQFPTQKRAMAKIITTNLSGIPCFVTEASSHNYRLVGLEVTADIAVINSYGLINLGDGSKAQNSLSLVPYNFVVDRCYIHGHSEATIMKYGVALNCANAAVIDSYISDFHSIGFDTQAISGINGPGPFKIINNYLEAAGENIMFGGAAAAIPNLVPSDIEIKSNYLFKPFSWKVGHSSYKGKHWTIKNLFELKTGKRVLFEGNILENSWADLPIGQSGYAILLTVRTEDGGSPQADVSDIIISNNIIRLVGAGIALSGRDDGSIGNRSKRILIFNNLFEDINGQEFGDMNIDGPNNGTFIKIGEPEDLIIDHNTIFQTGSITWVSKLTNGFVFTNNISNSFKTGAGYQGIYGPGVQQGDKTFEQYFKDVNDENQKFHKNILIGGDKTKYNNFNNNSQNYFVTDNSEVGFLDYNKGKDDFKNYSLKSASLYYKNGTDNKDLGVDFIKLDSALKYREKCKFTNVINVLDVFVSLNTLELKVGDTSKLDATVYPSDADNTNIIWSSSDDKIAIVNSIGLVTAIAIGKANVIVRTVDGNFTDTCKVVVSDELSVENNNITFSIFPNPAKDFININLINLELNSKVEIYNQLGEIVLTPVLTNKFLQDANNQIYVGNLSSGVYFIRIGNKTQMFVRN